jgi:anaerobic selenocysteine-containing dehydrogenase
MPMDGMIGLCVVMPGHTAGIGRSRPATAELRRCMLCRLGFCWRLEGIEQRGAGAAQVGDIAGDERPAMNPGCGGEQSADDGLRVRDVHAAPFLSDVVPAFRQGSNEFQPGSPVDPLPHYVPPPEPATGYRLNLISPKSHAYLNSSAADQPAQRRVQGEQAVTVNTQDAAERGIADGQYVRVFNDRGQFVALARITDQIGRGVVMAPMGAWPKNANGGSTVNAVTPFVFADLGNAPTFSDTRVEIEPT